MTNSEYISLLEKVYHQTAGDKLRASIQDDEMVNVYLSAGLLRDIADLLRNEKEKNVKMGDVQFVTDRQWDGQARRLEKKNFNEVGSSLSATAIAYAANSFIIDIRSDQGGMMVRQGWRKAMHDQAIEWRQQHDATKR